jgi:hypothetical protein
VAVTLNVFPSPYIHFRHSSRPTVKKFITFI